MPVVVYNKSDAKKAFLFLCERMRLTKMRALDLTCPTGVWGSRLKVTLSALRVTDSKRKNDQTMILYLANNETISK